MKMINDSANTFFSSRTTLIVNTAIGAILWLTNAVFNYLAKDYFAFTVNIMYVTCINIIATAYVRKANNSLQAAAGGLMVTFLLGNVNVILEMTSGTPSRTTWQLVVGYILALSLFINHFMLTSERRRKMWRIQINQLVVLLLLLLRVYQILANIIGHENVTDTSFLIETTVGLLAIVPTLNIVVCTECNTNAYKPNQNLSE